ncbi:MAG: glycosyltransferase [Candidatus Harrisonbacteria bacterium]|nr:glycosyltransferase [Candidatus Harrisonbacteria bacterium]
MKVALVHDYLNQYGGAERVLETFAEIFPDAPIYTLFYDKKNTFGRFEGRIKSTSFLNQPAVIKNHRPFIPIMPLAAAQINLGSEYDLVLSSSAGYAKGVRYNGHTFHIAYCHTPLRYAWEFDEYLDWHPILKLAASPAAWYLRLWDRYAGQKPKIILANSGYIAGKIKNYYGRQAEVIYPPVDLKLFYRDPKIKKGGYFLAAGRFLHYKKFDLAIQAFNRLNLPLLIAGDGPELENLKKIAKSPKIHFLPFAGESELRALYNGAEALIFPQIEDFGLVAAEAQACGTPVIAYGQGGAREIIEDGVTGILFHQQTADELTFAVKKFLLSSFDPNIIRESAKRFSKTKFKSKIFNIVKNLA